jgi:hypothetical protein
MNRTECLRALLVAPAVLACALHAGPTRATEDWSQYPRSGPYTAISGVPHDATVQGDHLFVALGPEGLGVYSMTDFSLVAALPDAAYSVTAGDCPDRIWAGGFDELLLVDASDPANPVLVDQYATPEPTGAVHQVAVAVRGDGTVRVMGAGPSSFFDAVFSSCASATPALHSVTGAPANLLALGAGASPDVAVGCSQDSLFVFDLTQVPAVVAHRIGVPGVETVAMVGATTCALAGTSLPFQTWSCSAASPPQQVATLTGGEGNHIGFPADAQSILANVLDYVRSKVQSVGVANPSAPELRWSVHFEGVAGRAFSGGYVSDDGAGGGKIVGVQTGNGTPVPALFQETSHPNTIAVAHSAADARCATATSGGALRVLDVSNPAQPILTRTYSQPVLDTDWLPIDHQAAQRSAGSSASYLLATTSDSLHVFDPADPRTTPVASTVGGVHLAVESDPAYAVVQKVLPSLALQIIDLAAPANPVPRGSVPMSLFALDIAVRGAEAVVCDFASATRYDCTDLDNPVVTGSLAAPTRHAAPSGIDGDWYLVDHVTGQLFRHDIDTGTSVSAAPGPSVDRLSVVGLPSAGAGAPTELVYGSNVQGSVFVWDWSVESSPVLLGEYTDVDFNPNDVTASEQAVFVADMTGGLCVLPAHAATSATAATAVAATASPRALGVAWPNPFASETSVPLALARETRAELGVYDVAGRRVRTLASGRMGAGSHVLRWDGRGEDGRRVAAGVYLLRLAVESGRETGKVVVLR